MTMIRTLIRHLVATVMAFLTGWLVPILLDLGYTTTEAETLLNSFEVAITGALMFLAYFATEKLLKPMWYKVFGEKQIEDPTANRF